MTVEKESLAIAFKSILDYVQNNLRMNPEDYNFGVYNLSTEQVGVFYFPKNHRAEHVLIFYQPFSPDNKIGHIRGNDIYMKLFLKQMNVNDSVLGDAVSVNGDSKHEFTYLKKNDLDEDFSALEEIDEKLKIISK